MAVSPTTNPPPTYRGDVAFGFKFPSKLRQLMNALADARLHLDRIPQHNKRALKIQEKIIAQREAEVAAELSKDKSWLKN